MFEVQECTKAEVNMWAFDKGQQGTGIDLRCRIATEMEIM